jgi:hypothetical protein
MANLFFSFPGELQEVTQVIFGLLGASSTVQRDSSNVLGGTYSVLSVLGFKIKLELNSYDYEDQYNYMLSVNEDYLTKLEVDEDMIEGVTDIVARLLSKNTSLKIAQEKEDGLVIHPMQNG